ncbi:CatB-related O-acetyltransferase [Streptomyces sp. QTS137]
MPAVPAGPTVLHPMPEHRRVVLLKPLVKSPPIDVGEYSYYDDPDDPTAFETRNALYHYGPERLVIGKFCALGTGKRFIMNGANHRMDGPSTFPFPTMGGSWAEHFDLITDLPGRGDTVVGNDVWFGHGTTVMPGVRIGHGAITASCAVVTGDVPDYGIVGGNPARLLRTRYDAEHVARFLAVARWNWPAGHVTEHVRTIMSGSVAGLEAAAPRAASVTPGGRTPGPPMTTRP